MTWTELFGAIAWGGLAALGFLGLLRRELRRGVSRVPQGYRMRAAGRVLATAAALALTGVVNSGLIPLAVVGFVGVRSVLVWRMGGCRGH